MKRLAMLAIAAAFLAMAFLGGYLYDRWSQTRPKGPEAGGRKILYYVDSMHPWYKSDKPGIAPDCGMKLTPVYADGGTAAPGGPAGGSETSRTILHYRDPKQPEYMSDKPGINPETGNDLEPVYGDNTGGALPGAIQVSADRQQLMGVRYGMAEVSAGLNSIRAVGKVAQDETHVTRVHAKVEGWIERVAVDFMGDLVRKGQILLTIYSPELLATQQEYLLALKARDVMHHSSIADAATNAESLAKAARRRLELLDIPAAQIAELEKSGTPLKSVPVYSPAAGYVIARNAFLSQRVTPETELYQIADLSHVWVMADVFESDAPHIRIGQSARLSSPNGEITAQNARVSYIQPQIDPVSRTVKVRLDVANPGNRLKPEAYVDVTFDVKTPARLQVPAEAVLDAGSRKTVFVDRGNGFLEPRTVETGERTGDRIEIRKGLQGGERIVTSGVFLLDSESQLRSALAGTTKSSGATPDGKAPPAPHGSMPGMDMPGDRK